jgi:hypothetical protein
MSLTAAISPSDLAPAKNPIFWKLSSSDSTCQYVIFEITLDGSVFMTSQVDKRADGYFYIQIDRAIMARFAEKAKANSWLFTPVALGTIQGDNANLVSFQMRAWEVLINATTGKATASDGDSTPGTGSPDLALTSTMFSIRAARQHWEKQLLSDYNSTAATNKFLTLQPDNYFVVPGQPHFLHFYCAADISYPVYMKVTVTLNNGTTTDYYSPAPYTMLKGLHVYPIGTAQLSGLLATSLAFSTAPTSVQSYTTRLVKDTSGGGTPSYSNVSELRTYIVNYTNDAYYHFMWLNSFGVYDTYTLHSGGFWRKLSKGESSVMQRTKDLTSSFDNATYSGQFGVMAYSIQGEQSYEVITDYMSAKMSEWLKHIAESEEVYMRQTTDYGTDSWIPILVEPMEQVVNQAKNNMPQIRFKFTLSHPIIRKP